MAWRTIGSLILFCMTVNAAEDFSSPAVGSTVEVECHGKLRCGMVAIGGETTGMNLTCKGVIWELSIADEKLKQFAESHHKQPVTVKGKLHRSTGTQRRDRWIVVVETLAARDPQSRDDAILISATGTVESDANSGFNLVTRDITWPLKSSENPQFVSKLETLVKKTATVKGKVDISGSKETSRRPAIILQEVRPETAKLTSTR